MEFQNKRLFNSRTNELKYKLGKIIFDNDGKY